MAVDQHPGGSLADSFGYRDRGDVGFDQGWVDEHVIGRVTGEPVDLVHDAVGDPVGLNVLQQPLQLGTVSPSRELSGVDELLHDDRAELLGLTSYCVPLGRDREPLVPTIPLSLLTRRDPQVADDTEQRRGDGS